MSKHDPLYEARDAERRAATALTKLSLTREAAARTQDAAARSLVNYLVDHLTDVLAGVPNQAASLTAEYQARRAAWVEACEAYIRAFDRWKRAYEQRKRMEDNEIGDFNE
jgi:HD superfamily phosphodiesterase